MEYAIEVKNLYKLYRVGDEVVRALKRRGLSDKKRRICGNHGSIGFR